MEKDFDIVSVFASENEIAALADGDFSGSRNQSLSKPGFVTPWGSIANRSFVSSTLNGLVDNLIKPAEGIEPSSQRMTNPESLQAAGYLSEYHDVAIYLCVDNPHTQS
ncbi:MAG: hypothetical protein Q8O94_02095 [bacterium]|nr:hypothetical protein [bacterium]